MKKVSYLLAALLLGITGCTVAELDSPQAKTDKQITITATREGGDPDTKTVRDESNGAVLWAPGDRISLFYGSGTDGGSMFTAQNQENANVTNFTGTIGVITGGADVSIENTYFWGVYPYGEDVSCDGSSVTLTLADRQEAVPGTFATNLFPSIGRSSGLNMGFYNVCGGLKIQVQKEGIKKVTLHSNDGPIAGTARIVLSESGVPTVSEIVDGKEDIVLEAPAGQYLEPGQNYYFVTFPHAFTSQYFTLTFENDFEIGTYERKKALTIKRSVFEGFSVAIDSNVSYESKMEPLNATKYLTFTSEGETTLSLQQLSEDNPAAPVLYYSFDRENWTKWNGYGVTFSSGSPLYLCGDNEEGLNKGYSNGVRFTSSGDNFGVSGDIMSLIDYENDVLEIPSAYCFCGLFEGCTGLTTAPELPATTLANESYYRMFYGCTGLTTAPELPATTLANECYGYMFYGCTGLTTAPELPATTLASGCYYGMFYGCTGLTTAPELPATTLANDCYNGMFNRCTSLTTAPELPATTLAIYCYSSMFSGCTGLTTAPELPATTLADRCYYRMFSGCTNLNYVKCLATDISAGNCLSGWLNGVADSGTFVKAPGMSGWPTGSNGIPSGWSVVNDVGGTSDHENEP